MITVYNTTTGESMDLVHPIDAKEAVKSGHYTYSTPGPKKAVVEPKKVATPKPAVIEKPVVKEEELPEEEEAKKEVATEPKPIRKIIRQ